MKWWPLCLMLVCLGCEKVPEEKAVRPVRAVQLEKAELVRLHTFPGRTRAVDRVNLSFRVGGPLKSRPAFVGMVAQQGELLAQIDPRDYEVKVQTEQGKLEKAEADLRFAERDYERSLNIWKKDPGAISESFLDKKKEDVNRLKGEVLSLEGSLDAVQDQLSYTEMLAPFHGVIVSTYVDNFEYVEARQPILRILNTSQVEMVIDVPESLITHIGEVDEIQVEFDAIPGRIFPATIKEIGTEATLTTRTYPVTLVVDQPEDVMILAGMAGHAYLSSSRAQQFSQEGFLVPTTAIFTDSETNTTYVWVIEGEVTLRREVVKGPITPDGILISQGLQEGEWIATAGVNLLEEGQKVTLLPEGNKLP